MATSIRYAVDLACLQLDENVAEIQVLPFGTYQHPLHGTLNFDSERAERFAHNINNGVRKQDLDIDYDHKKYNGKAAGWIKSARVLDDGLYATVEWTQPALQEIKNKEYRYFSPEFMPKWKDPKSGTEYQDVMAGGALTNRPFLKDIKPINLGEIQMEEILAALRKRYKLSDDADEATVLAAISEDTAPKAEDAEVKMNDGQVEVTIPGVEGTVTYKPELSEPVEKPEEDEHLKKLAEDNPAIAQMLEERKADAERIRKLEEAHVFSEVNEKLNGLKTDKFQLAPVVLDEARKVALKLDENERSQFYSVLEKAVDGGIIEMGERADGGNPSADADHVVDQAHNRITKLAEEKSLSYREAAKIYFSEEADYNEYRSTVKEGGQ